MPTPVDALWALPVQQLAAGERHSAALTGSGFLFTWGSNTCGQLGLPAGAEVAAQNQVIAPSRALNRYVVDIFAICLGTVL